MPDDAEALTKVHVDLPNHWLLKGEAIWALSLGDDLYEIRNVPFGAYGLNCLDVVLATADSPSLKPEIRKVIRRSGHRTLRLMFHEDITKEQQAQYLAQQLIAVRPTSASTIVTFASTYIPTPITGQSAIMFTNSSSRRFSNMRRAKNGSLDPLMTNPRRTPNDRLQLTALRRS